MSLLSFAAFLSNDDNVEMKDASPTALSPSMEEVPLTFDFEFETDEVEQHSHQTTQKEIDMDGLELRSPRTPTYTGGLSLQTDPLSPFDADKFFDFPILSVSEDISPLASLSYSSAGKSHANLHTSFDCVKENQSPVQFPPPKDPLMWIWTCHLCRSRYPLGATRRCLVDGHFYCSGENSPTSQRNIKKRKKGQACSSEFDYVGWQEWGDWRQNVMKSKRQVLTGKNLPSPLKGCESCEYPSQCRYEKMNQIPEVVAAVSKKTNRASTGTMDATSSSDKTISDSKMKKHTLKVDSGATSKQKRDKGNKGSAANELELTGKSKSAFSSQDKVSSSRAKISKPLSPDLVDFASMVSNSAPIEINTAVKESQIRIQALDSFAIDRGLDIFLDAMSTPDTTGEMPKLTRNRSRRKGESRQSRINDFFGIAR